MIDDGVPEHWLEATPNNPCVDDAMRKPYMRYSTNLTFALRIYGTRWL